MINVQQGINLFALSLNERITLENPNLLMELEYTQSSPDKKIMLVLDTSAQGDRLNLITIEVVANEADEDLSAAKVYLMPGDYYYKVYESTDTALDITGKNRIERGILKYDVDTNTDEVYTDNPDEKIYRG